jgi:hypothetical protein
MDIRKLQKIVVNALEDIKGKDIEVINTTKLTSLFDRWSSRPAIPTARSRPGPQRPGQGARGWRRDHLGRG